MIDPEARAALYAELGAVDRDEARLTAAERSALAAGHVEPLLVVRMAADLERLEQRHRRLHKAIVKAIR